jgi:hypothetical protein
MSFALFQTADCASIRFVTYCIEYPVTLNNRGTRNEGETRTSFWLIVVCGVGVDVVDDSSSAIRSPHVSTVKLSLLVVAQSPGLN